MNSIKNVAVIGTGVIGIGWIIRCLAHGKKVKAYDLKKKSRIKVLKEIKRSSQYVKKMFRIKKINLKNLSFHKTLKDVLFNSEFIIECAPENYKIKINLMEEIGKNSKTQAIISSSSSGLLPTKIYSKCLNPELSLIHI